MTDAEYDIVIVGSGGGGLSGALAAAEAGARVVVVDSSERVGGTFAYSAGLVWVPDNHLMAEAGFQDSAAEALAHIRELSGGRHDDAVLQSFVQHAPEVVRWLAEDIEVPFELVGSYPDYYSDRTGGKEGGRHLSSRTFAPRDLLPPEWQSRLATSPHFAGLPASWLEIQEWGGLASMATWDWHEMARRLTADHRSMGSAIMGYLLAACLKRTVEIRLGCRAERLVTVDGRVTGVEVTDADGRVSTLRAAKGVLLATGGFDANDDMKRQLDPYADTHGIGSPTVDGSGLVMALEIGARFHAMDGQLTTPTFAIPGEEADGRQLYRSAVREPAFPGGIVVNTAGRRFCDESFYRSLCHEMAAFDVRSQSYPNAVAHLVFDQRWKDDYALGPVSPGETPPWIVSADTPQELASLIGADGAALAATLDTYNRDAVRGEDPEFGRGSTKYGRNSGDRTVIPNPCVRALEGRLYAVRLHLGSSGTNSGLAFDPVGRVRHVRGHLIPGLYVAGNAGANLVEGYWYNSGSSNAKALTFGYLAVRDMLDPAAPDA
jgi:succinate dehydrogenase/fumarate reductase flavoprotein subunit